mmetsp:Transcript_44142/g.109285  ORF Transcript_44142/g.109285 Transcript_44142/m.109285 type:complete len:373 (-) Transcript_44142:58-1176(-)
MRVLPEASREKWPCALKLLHDIGKARRIGFARGSCSPGHCEAEMAAAYNTATAGCAASSPPLGKSWSEVTLSGAGSAARERSEPSGGRSPPPRRPRGSAPAAAPVPLLMDAMASASVKPAALSSARGASASMGVTAGALSRSAALQPAPSKLASRTRSILPSSREARSSSASLVASRAKCAAAPLATATARPAQSSRAGVTADWPGRLAPRPIELSEKPDELSSAKKGLQPVEPSSHSAVTRSSRSSLASRVRSATSCGMRVVALPLTSDEAAMARSSSRQQWRSPSATLHEKADSDASESANEGPAEWVERESEKKRERGSRESPWRQAWVGAPAREMICSKARSPLIAGMETTGRKRGATRRRKLGEGPI